MSIKYITQKDFHEHSLVDGQTAQLIRNMENISNSAVVLIGGRGKILYFNTHAENMYELGPSLRGADQNILEIIKILAHRGDFGPGDPSKFFELAVATLNDDGIKADAITQTYLTMPSGNILRLRLSRNADGTILLAANDISDQKRDENMLEMALDIGFAGYLIFDTVQNKCRVESRYMKSLLTHEEFGTLENSGLSSLFHSDDLARSQDMWSSVNTTGDTERGTLRLITQKHGVRWFRFVLMPETDTQNRTRIIAFFNDVTDTLRQQENLRQAKRLAEDSLSSKENFLARMSHEIRTPMNAVIGMADALIHHNSDNGITPQLELIQKSAVSILKMLDETLTHSRLDTDSFALDPTPASPREVVRDVCALWEQQALKNNGVIRCVIKDSVPETIVFDKFLYEQCVNNLLSNAVKFTHGGKIDVILTVVEKKAGTPLLVLAVRDTGIGMTRDQQSKIFEAYTQADKSISSRFGGTGLGMNITKQIVDRMEGTISVRSEIGSGTMFAMSVPLITPDSAVLPATSAAPDESPLAEVETIDAQDVVPVLPAVSPESHEATSTMLVDDMLEKAEPEVTAYSALRILVVDDNPTNHLVINSLLGTVVADITLASNGTEALEVLDTAPIDIVLMDIHMPIMDGIECTLAIRSSDKPWRDVTIIALTADPQYQQKQLCKNIGMDEALAKPVRLNDLLEAMDSVLPSNKQTVFDDRAPSIAQIA